MCGIFSSLFILNVSCFCHCSLSVLLLYRHCPLIHILTLNVKARVNTYSLLCRLYYHSVSNQPVLSNDFDADSDGEDTEWGRIASSRLIDEFIDVNKGEKELMKLWNNFVSRNPS